MSAHDEFQPEKHLYHYKATVVRVIDGDSVILDVDLGMNMVLMDRRTRLSGINAPETRGVERPQGLLSKEWLVNRIEGKEVVINTVKDKSGRYGRLICTIYLDGVNINDALVEAGHAEYRTY